MNNGVVIRVIVEGPTEQTFVRDVLAPPLAQSQVYLMPSRIGPPGHKGGNVRFDRATKDIGIFLKQEKNTYVTTMFDFYGIDQGWPGKNSIAKNLSSAQKASILETATSNEIVKIFSDLRPESRFVPYFSMYEFEAILFSSSQILAGNIGVKDEVIEKILEECQEPEEINDGPDTSPSKRIKAICRSYQKISMGTRISKAIGISEIRSKCPHFNKWLVTLESLGR